MKAPNIAMVCDLAWSRLYKLQLQLGSNYYVKDVKYMDLFTLKQAEWLGMTELFAQPPLCTACICDQIVQHILVANVCKMMWL